MRARLILIILSLGLIFAHSARAQNAQVTPTAPVNPAPVAATIPPAVQPTPQYVAPAAVAPKPVAPQAAAPTIASQPAQLPATQTAAQPAIVAAAKPAVPAVASAPTAPPLSAQAEAEKLIELMHIKDNTEQMMNTIIVPMIASQSKSLSTQNNRATNEIVTQETTNALHYLVDAAQKHAISIYAQDFTADELHTLNQFYASPVGQKTVLVVPKMMQQYMENSMADMEKIMPAVMQRIKTRLANAGITPPNSGR